MGHLAKAAQAFSGGSLPDDLCLVAVRPRFEQRWYGEASEPRLGRAAGL